ncbi:hypothetical protein MBLNU459_g1203t1 [Dothideomycetes sp. NU459]
MDSALGIAAAPAHGQLVEHNGVTYGTVKEGLAHILVPPNARTSTDPQAKNKTDEESQQTQNVFYNPIQQFNRDLSVLAIRAFGEDLISRRRQKSAQKFQQNQNKSKRKAKKRQGKDRDDDEGKRRKGNDGLAVIAEKAAEAEENGHLARAEGLELPAEEDQSEAKQDAELQTKSNLEEAEPTEVDEAAANGAEIPGAIRKDNEKQADGHNAYIPRFRILDALSATGLRALRYAHEIPFASSVTANDMSPAAVSSIALNVEHNKLTSKITPSVGNAIAHMYNAAFYVPGSAQDLAGAHTAGKYDVIDLDPYGTAVPFLDGAVQALNDGGMLCVTCTDAGVFASCGYVEKTFSLYGGLPLKGPHSHEVGLRLILNAIASSAAKYGIAIEPLLSLSIDYYARVFVRIRKSPADVKFLAGKTMVAHQCDSGCGAWSTQYLARHTAQPGRTNFKHIAGQSSSDKNCPHCGFKTHVAGPMWGGPLHNPFFIQRILDALPAADKSTYMTTTRIEGMLTSALDELDVLDASLLTPAAGSDTSAPSIPTMPAHALDSHPFFAIPSAMAKVLHCQAPSEAAIKGALRHAGYVATRSHTKPGTIKTQASWEAMWEIMREWVRQKAPVKEGKVGSKMAGHLILQKMRKADPVAEKEKESEDAGVAKGEEVNEEQEREQGKEGKPQPVDVGKMKVVFDEVLGKDKPGKKLMRYQLNPRANWGPMNRARGGH